MAKIIITGFMGTGKSFVGKMLAEKLGYVFKDMDEIIVKENGMTISEIFDKFGEAFFRSLEMEVLERELIGERMVISTGGGAVIAAENRKIMRREGLVVNITATPEAIFERLMYDNNRPLLMGVDRISLIKKILAERDAYYADADIQIDTTGKNVDDVVREIIDEIKLRYDLARD
jgi:shikimate kinase